MSETIRVLNSVVILNADGKPLLECNMSDGSTWTCDIEGKNWKQEKLGNDELTKLFNNINK